MANVLHFQKRKETLLESLIRYLNPGGRLLLVEYNTDRGNHWVPYPLSYPSWQALAKRAGLTGIRLLKRVPSSFLGEFYSAVSFKP
jgi:ubiquinone/menaquinone biosynthesis C-methylase UbiE